jgi:hypothetical protein
VFVDGFRAAHNTHEFCEQVLLDSRRLVPAAALSCFVVSKTDLLDSSTALHVRSIVEDAALKHELARPVMLTRSDRSESIRALVDFLLAHARAHRTAMSK